MAVGRLMYKCRLCGEVELRYSAPDLDTAVLFIMKGWSMPKDWGVMKPDMTEPHTCGPGRTGVADFIGGVTDEMVQHIEKTGTVSMPKKVIAKVLFKEVAVGDEIVYSGTETVTIEKIEVLPPEKQLKPPDDGDLKLTLSNGKTVYRSSDDGCQRVRNGKGSFCGCGSTKYGPDHKPWDHAGWTPD